MKINEIIRARRLAKNLTQEQMASYLGVTAPAVHKWEKGSSYPDITLLPALARLLDTDLNTLLSFREELDENEIALFLNRLSEIYDSAGMEAAYSAAMVKLQEYPTCFPLILNTALLLDGLLLMGAPNQASTKERNAHYRPAIESLYQRVLSSPDPAIQSQAQSMLISRYMERQEFQKAEELLQTLPDKNPIDRKQLQINLLIATNRLEEAAKLEEEQLLSSASNLLSLLMTLMEIAWKENRIEDAEYIADVSRRSAELFDLWEYTSYVALFQLYSARQDKANCLRVAAPMLKSLTQKWDITNSPLYRHIKAKEPEKGLGPKFQQSILRAICEDPETAFLQNSPDFQNLIKEIDTAHSGKSIS